MKIEFAKSLSGHDKNQIYVIAKKEGRFAYLVNGSTHPIDKPKKKNEKHYQIIKEHGQDLEQFNDEGIRRIIKNYIGSINK